MHSSLTYKSSITWHIIDFEGNIPRSRPGFIVVDRDWRTWRSIDISEGGPVIFFLCFSISRQIHFHLNYISFIDEQYRWQLPSPIYEYDDFNIIWCAYRQNSCILLCIYRSHCNFLPHVAINILISNNPSCVSFTVLRISVLREFFWLDKQIYIYIYSFGWDLNIR